MKNINHYKIISKLGSGGMGEVYKAFDTKLERNVAIKVMHKHLLKDQKNEQRFLTEARSAAKLVHPNLVTIYEIGKAEIGLYIAMEFIEGSSLSQVLKPNNSLSPHKISNITINVLEGIAAAHKMGILHRDIKPDNIFLTTEDKVKILDFGIAQLVANPTAAIEGDITGTIDYMAPEQMLGEETDHTCDIYSTGVVFYQALTNRLPFTGESPVDVLFKKLNEQPILPSYFNDELNPDLNQVILKALSPDKSDRWESAQTFIKEIQACSFQNELPINDKKPANPMKVVDKESTGQSAYIGRENEFNALIGYYRKVARGEGHTIILKGEAGIGKTSIAKQLINFAEQHDSIVLFGDCLYQEGLDAYHPFIEALKKFINKDSYKLVGEKRNEILKLIQEKVPILIDFIDQDNTFPVPISDNSSGIPGENQTKLLEGLTFIISFLASVQPVIMVIDDIQWADEASLRLFHYLARNIKRQRILLLGISRTDRYDLQNDGKPTAVVDVLSRMNRERLYKEIILHRLTNEETDKLIDNLLSPSLFTEEFYDNIHKETKGNPFFLIETINKLKETGSIYQQDDLWYDKQNKFKVEVPDRVEDIFVRRLSALNTDEQEILQVAAVLGTKFDVTLLSRLLETSKIRLLKTLQRIENDLQIIMSSETGYHFEHPMLQDMLLEQISPMLRKEYHLMAAQELEKNINDKSIAHINELARHYFNGENYEKAVPLLYQAGEYAMKLSAFRDASSALEDILQAVEKNSVSILDSISLNDIYFKLDICYHEIGRWDQNLEILKKLLQSISETENPTEYAEALIRLGMVYDKLGDLDTALKQYNLCLTIVEKNNIEDMYSRIYNNLGVVNFERGNYNKALDYFTNILSNATEKTNNTMKANAYNNIATIYNIQGNHENALETYHQALDLFKQNDDQKGIARIYHNIGMTQTDLQDWTKAIRAFEKCLDVAEGIEDKHLRALTYLNMGKAFARKGDLIKAYNYVSKSLKIFKRIADILSIAEAYHIYGLIYTSKKDFTKAENYFRKSIQINQHKDYQEGLAENYLHYGHLCREFDKLDHAKICYEKAIESFQNFNADQRVETLKEYISAIEKESSQVEPANQYVNQDKII